MQPGRSNPLLITQLSTPELREKCTLSGQRQTCISNCCTTCICTRHWAVLRSSNACSLLRCLWNTTHRTECWVIPVQRYVLSCKRCTSSRSLCIPLQLESGMPWSHRERKEMCYSIQWKLFVWYKETLQIAKNVIVSKPMSLQKHFSIHVQSRSRNHDMFQIFFHFFWKEYYVCVCTHTCTYPNMNV